MGRSTYYQGFTWAVHGTNLPEKVSDMSNNHPQLELRDGHTAEKQETHDSGAPVWFTSLVHETTQLERTGVHAAMLSLRVRDDGQIERRASQIQHLLARLLRPTDQLGQTSPTSFSLLLAPLQSIADTTSHVHMLTGALKEAGLSVWAGYAQRRSGESLLDTWARAEAQADRAAFRAAHSQGLNLAE
jgi:hypothetical protein